jgi:hypothetical protein
MLVCWPKPASDLLNQTIKDIDFIMPIEGISGGTLNGDLAIRWILQVVWCMVDSEVTYHTLDTDATTNNS